MATLLQMPACQSTQLTLPTARLKRTASGRSVKIMQQNALNLIGEVVVTLNTLIALLIFFLLSTAEVAH